MEQNAPTRRSYARHDTYRGIISVGGIRGRIMRINSLHFLRRVASREIFIPEYDASWRRADYPSTREGWIRMKRERLGLEVEVSRNRDSCMRVYALY